MEHDRSDPAFTPAQYEALEKAYDILGEHFEGFIIAVRTESANPEDQNNPQEARQFYYFGGVSQALGLAASMQNHLLKP